MASFRVLPLPATPRHFLQDSISIALIICRPSFCSMSHYTLCHAFVILATCNITDYIHIHGQSLFLLAFSSGLLLYDLDFYQPLIIFGPWSILKSIIVSSMSRYTVFPTLNLNMPHLVSLCSIKPGSFSTCAITTRFSAKLSTYL